MMSKRKKIFWGDTLILILIIISPLVQPTPSLANKLLHTADSLYTTRHYIEALDHYRLLLANDQFLKDNFIVNFKIGICNLNNKKFDEAEKIFYRLSTESEKIQEYTAYYLFLSRYAFAAPEIVFDQGQKFINTYSEHFLADSVRLKLADYAFGVKRFNQAHKNYSKLMGSKHLNRLKPYFISQQALCHWYSGNKKLAYDKMLEMMNKFPDSDEAMTMADLFLNQSIPSEKFEFAIAEVYLKHRRYRDLTQRLESFIKQTGDPISIEKARLYLIQIYYEKGQYKTALYGFKNLLKEVKNESLESKIRLWIARSYLRLDEGEKAVTAYLDYAERYPRRRMAVECVWKSAWIYEEMGDLSKSIEVNQHLLTHWPRSAYRNEALFRIGLNYLRLGDYQSAESVFTQIYQTNGSEFHRSRSKFWLAKLFEIQGTSEKSEQLYRELAEDLFISYYTLKSYMMYKNQIDSVNRISDQLGSEINPLRFSIAEMNQMIEKFSDLFLIRELLGYDIALQELAGSKYYPASLEGWIALAETYKRLGAYNRAYQVYDYIDNNHFSDLETIEKPFLLKEAYPLYYDNIIEIYGVVRDLNKNLVLALIRAESSFNSQAHSWADAYGLMQIIPRTAKALATELEIDLKNTDELFDPELNINLGTQYLKNLLMRFDNRPEYAIAAYNAGPHRVERWQKYRDSEDVDFFVENIEYSQTRNYVRKVMKNYWIYLLLEEAN